MTTWSPRSEKMSAKLAKSSVVTLAAWATAS